MLKNKKSQPLLSIGELAQFLNIHQRTLQIYDKQGILSPQRNEKNRRKYSFEDLYKAQIVLFLTRNLGVNLAGVKVILGLLERFGVDFEVLREIALGFGMDEKVQEGNVEKSLRKGRKAISSY